MKRRVAGLTQCIDCGDYHAHNLHLSFESPAALIAALMLEPGMKEELYKLRGSKIGRNRISVRQAIAYLERNQEPQR